jgi:6-phosphogluconolactonase
MRMSWGKAVLAVVTCTGLWAAGGCGARAQGEAGQTGEALTSDEGRDGRQSGDGRSRTRNVYALTNDELNGVVRYSRGSDGRLTWEETTSSGGRGTAGLIVPDLVERGVDPLFSNEAVLLSEDGRWAFAVNPLSDSVASFRVHQSGRLERIGTVPSGGRLPNSLAFNGRVLYVSNVGQPAKGVPATVSGFLLDHDGELHPIHGSTRQLADPSRSFPTHVLFTSEGDRLLVADLMAGTISIFPLRNDGRLGEPTHNPSAGAGPFGFYLVDRSTLLVSEAMAGALSSYRLNGTHLQVISPSVANGQMAACWVSITPDRRLAFVSNTASGNVSVYTLDAHGRVALLHPAEAFRPGIGDLSSGPVDSVVSDDGHFFFQHYSGRGEVGAYLIEHDGRLTPIPHADGLALPKLGSTGLVGG